MRLGSIRRAVQMLVESSSHTVLHELEVQPTWVHAVRATHDPAVWCTYVLLQYKKSDKKKKPDNFLLHLWDALCGKVLNCKP